MPLRGPTLAFPLALALLTGASACALDSPPGGEDPRAQSAAGASAELSAFGYLSLCCGSRETVVNGIAAVENLAFSEDGRFFASGDEGVFELARDAAGVLQATRVSEPASCHFGGMAVVHGTLYAGCYDFTDSYLYAARLDRGGPLRAIQTLGGVALANGMTADSAGNLYLASSLDDTILRVQLAASDPLRVTSVAPFLASTGGLFPNGLKYFDGSLYFSDFTALRRVRIDPAGKPGRIVTFVDQLTFYDDLYVDANGVLVANFLGGSLEAYTPNGVRLGQSSALVAFDGPSAVVPANGRLGFSASDILVAEKNSNRVAVFHPRF